MKMKKIISLALTFVMLFAGVISFAGCNDGGADGDSAGSGDGSGGATSFTYTVYVKSGSAGIEGAKVAFTNVNDSSDKTLVTTDKNGKATVTSNTEKSYKATVTQVPADYRDAGWSITETKTLVDGSATFTYTTVDLPDWTVVVLSPDGAPVAGVEVQMCSGEICFKPITTEESGTAVFADFATSEYHVKLNSIPAAYSYPEGKDKDSYYYFESGNTITITLSQAN